MSEEIDKQEKLPQDDTFAQMSLFATVLTMSKGELDDYLDKKIFSKKRILNLKKQGINIDEQNFRDNLEKLIEGKVVTINDSKYKVAKIEHDNSGLQVIVFECVESSNSMVKQGESVFAIGGSYTFYKFLNNPVEWKRDWVDSDARTGLGHYPKQFKPAQKILTDYKEKYNIKYITGFSLGAIIGGMSAALPKNRDLKAYLYNGGLPVNMLELLKHRHLVEQNPDLSNIQTFLSQKEVLTYLISVENGSDIYLSNIENENIVGHDIYFHLGLGGSNYSKVTQQGLLDIYGFKSSVSENDNGFGIQYNVPMDVNKPYKKNKSEIPDNEVNVSDKHVIKEQPPKNKSKIKSLEYLHNDETDKNEAEKSENDLFENTESDSNYPAESNEEKSYNAEDLQGSADSTSKTINAGRNIPLSEWSSEVLDNGDKVSRMQYNDPDYGFPVTWEIREKKKKYPPSYFELYEVVEDIVVSLLDDFIRFMGYEEVHKL